MENLQVMPDEQFAFWAGHNTTLPAAAKMTTDVFAAFNQQMSTEKTFDTVWHAGPSILITSSFPYKFVQQKTFLPSAL